MDSVRIVADQVPQVASAAERLFNAAELRENILSMASAQALIKLTQVNNELKSTILSSPTYRTQMFLDPVKERKEWVRDNTGEVIVLTAGDREAYDQQWVDQHVFKTVGKLNTVLFTDMAPSMERPLSFEDRVVAPDWYHHIYLLKHPDLSAKHNSYHDMFLTQPPACKVTLDISYGLKADHEVFSLYGKHKNKIMLIENAEGVKYGDLIKAFTQEFRAGSPERPVSENVVLIGGETLNAATSMIMMDVVLPTEDDVKQVEGKKAAN